MQIFTAVILEAHYEQSLIFLAIFINNPNQMLATLLCRGGTLSYLAHTSLTTLGKMQKMY